MAPPIYLMEEATFEVDYIGMQYKAERTTDKGNRIGARLEFAGLRQESANAFNRLFEGDFGVERRYIMG